MYQQVEEGIALYSYGKLNVKMDTPFFLNISYYHFIECTVINFVFTFYIGTHLPFFSVSDLTFFKKNYSTLRPSKWIQDGAKYFLLYYINLILIKRRSGFSHFYILLLEFTFYTFICQKRGVLKIISISGTYIEKKYLCLKIGFIMINII